ncbi:uncharacterized protein LOC114880646 [Osmia bicornis bicornis]|uniref:uncharacterized protein LOC114880646 n=1 Tax=Osmia bicornis bicornis TaxID=1437191 RepID=UPI001EAEF615|nr:uncharacterized protein LOC114880646 [Osmia bicornis bicornis]
MLHQHWPTTLTLLFYFIGTIYCKLHTEPLNNSTVFLEHIDNCYLYTNQVSISIIINPHYLLKQPEVIAESLKGLSKHCNKCAYKTEIQNLVNELVTIQKMISQLKLTLRIIHRRGLLNIVGSVSKSLFRTLDENDLTIINENMDKLFDSNNK